MPFMTAFTRSILPWKVNFNMSLGTTSPKR